MDVSSVYAEGRSEALRHKWIASERAQRDLGPSAVQEWVRHHWYPYLRCRWFEHVQGKRYYLEFEPHSFGVLQTEFSDALLIDRIYDRLQAGHENLDIIQWALTWNIPMDRVVEVLEALDVNSCRLSCHFSDGHC